MYKWKVNNMKTISSSIFVFIYLQMNDDDGDEHFEHLNNMCDDSDIVVVVAASLSYDDNVREKKAAYDRYD